MQLDLHDRAAFLTAVRRAKKPVAFLVGSALSIKDGKGSPGVVRMIELMREYVRDKEPHLLQKLDDTLASKTGTESYQAAMRWIQGNLSPDDVNEVVQQATLLARPRMPPGTDPLKGDGEPEEWDIPPGTLALARLVCAPRQPGGPDYSGPILTTNFDPLISLAVRTVSKWHAMNVSFDTDGSLNILGDDPGIKIVVHLHGFWRPSRVRTTSTLHTAIQLSSSRPQLRASLQNVLRQHTLVVLGYGGWDDTFTKALSELLYDDAAKLDVIWCFYGTDPARIQNEYAALLQSVEPAMIKGQFRAYGGIDCHTVLDELLPPPAAGVPTSTTDSPSPTLVNRGWELLDQNFSDLLPLTGRQVVQYFDGAEPSLVHAVSNNIPRREDVGKWVREFKTAKKLQGFPTLGLIRAAAGEGKSTVLLQTAVDMAREKGWSVMLRKSGYQPQLDIGLVDRLDKARSWLLAIDDVDTQLVDNLLATLRAMRQKGRRNVHFLIAARDTDWHAAGGTNPQWTEIVKLYDRTLPPLSDEDAQNVVDAWAAHGNEGLGALAEGDPNTRVKRLQQAIATEAAHGGSFFGGLLLARLDDHRLAEHVATLLERLGGFEIEGSSSSLYDALVYIAMCDRAKVPGIHETVLADLLNVPHDKVWKRVMERLGSEAAPATRGSNRHIVTRHRRVADAILAKAYDDLDINLALWFRDLVLQTEKTGRTVKFGPFHSAIVHASNWLQHALPDHIPLEHRREIAFAAARASVEAEPTRISRVVDLGKTYRNAGKHKEAAGVFRDNWSKLDGKIDYDEAIRGFWSEWALTESQRQTSDGNATGVWLSGLALSDMLAPAPITLRDINIVLSTLGDPLQGLVDKKEANNVFAKGLSAVAYLGSLKADAQGKRVYPKFAEVARAMGAPVPADTDQAILWFTSTVLQARQQIHDDVPREVRELIAVSFTGLRNVCAQTK